MTDLDLIKELNKILTLEHGHLGMYRDYAGHQEKEVRRTFRRFMEIETEHIEKIRNLIMNLGAKPSLIIESGDILGRMLGVTLNLTSTKNIIETYSFIEKKSHQGYYNFIGKLEQGEEKRDQFVAEFLASNMIEAKLQQLWLEDHLRKY